MIKRLLKVLISELVLKLRILRNNSLRKLRDSLDKHYKNVCKRDLEWMRKENTYGKS